MTAVGRIAIFAIILMVVFAGAYALGSATEPAEREAPSHSATSEGGHTPGHPSGEPDE